ncbi:MAG: Hsp20/alpha crystallin family protein [Chloroflexi bacterium]|nr:Hsp20/alpha crystallin family protein [Chloroflexota bacterium]
MTIARRPSPFGELVSLRQAMDRLFEDSFVRPRMWAGSALESSSLALDAKVTADELLVRASLPGVKPEDVEITIENGTLTISGESRSETKEESDQYLLQEIRRGTFARSVTLPNGLEADKAAATFDNGILTLRIPRAEQVKPRTIRITPTSDGSARDISTAGAGHATARIEQPA